MFSELQVTNIGRFAFRNNKKIAFSQEVIIVHGKMQETARERERNGSWLSASNRGTYNVR